MKRKNMVTEHASYNWSKDSIRIIATASNVAKTTYFYAQEVGYFKTVYPYFTERKNLNSFLILYVIAGKGCLEYGGQVYKLVKGQCFYIHCIEHHRYWAEKGEEWEFLWLHFNGNSALGYYKEFMKEGFRILKEGSNSILENSLHQIVLLHRKKNRRTEILTSNLIHQMLTELLIQNETSHTDVFYIPDYIKNIAKDIEENFVESLTLEEFATTYNRSKFHMSKEFKKYIGVTLNEYIIRTRISSAKELLRYSEYSVQEIALAVGVSNVTHFINLFKAREHMTPLSYRREWRN